MDLLLVSILLAGQVVIAVLAVVIPSYLKKKGKNLADLEDQPAIAKLVEHAKAPITKEIQKELEQYKSSLDLSKKILDFDHEIRMKAYDFTLQRVIELDRRVSDCFWLYLDKPQTRNATDPEWNQLQQLRRFTFDSTLYLDQEIFRAALDLSIAFDTLMRLTGTVIDREEYYTRLSDSVSTKLDTFKAACKKRYHFDRADQIIQSTKELIESFRSIQE